jgi:hypothetical protein
MNYNFIKGLVTLLTIIFSVQTIAQTPISFECGGYEFTINPDTNSNNPLKFTMKAGDDIIYDYQGRVSYIGDIDIQYDYQGRVSYIGDIDINYDYKGNISYIGDMQIKYDYQGRITGSSGSVDCNFDSNSYW